MNANTGECMSEKYIRLRMCVVIQDMHGIVKKDIMNIRTLPLPFRVIGYFYRKASQGVSTVSLLFQYPMYIYPVFYYLL